MPAPPSDNLRVVKYAQGWGYSAAEWERALRAIDWSRPHAEGGPERLKIRDLPDGSRDATVWRATLTLGPRAHEQRHGVVLKVDPLDSPKKKVQALFRRTKAFRQWRGAHRLDHAGFRVSTPYAILRGSGSEVLVMEPLPGRTALECMTDDRLPVREQHELARALGLLIVRANRVYSADFKPSNLVAFPGKGPREIAIVDTVDVRAGYDPVRQLADLMIEPAGIGIHPRVALRARVLTSIADSGLLPAEWGPGRKHAIRDLSHAVRRRVRAHGDPTPKHDPLARA